MKKLLCLILLSSYLLQFCTNTNSNIKEGSGMTLNQYYDTTGRDDILWGGMKMIKINTPKGDFNVWTKRVGNNPKIKVLLLHGGPGGSHESFLCFDSFFPREAFEYYYYDQLGSYLSDQPDDTALWKIDRFVEEVEQVRKALKLDSSNFYLFGKSWGGMLAIDYTLKYQKNLKGLIISNMTSSAKAYNDYVKDILAPQMDPKALAEIREIEKNNDFTNPKYMELLWKEFYTKFLFRIPANEIPGFTSQWHSNSRIYNLMQGPSEFGLTGTLKSWDREKDLKQIYVPTLTIGAKYDEMNPEHMKWMSTQVKNGRFLFCPTGSHYAMYDDQKIYFTGLIKFIKDVDQGLMENK